MRKILLLLAMVVVVVNVKTAKSQTTVQQPTDGPVAIPLKAAVAYTQDFPKVSDNGEGLQTGGRELTNLPKGWAFSAKTKSKTKDANASYFGFSGGSSSVATGRGVVSCGNTIGAAERALGAITGGGVANAHNIKIGAKFINNSGVPITSLHIEYTGEQWRRFITASAGSGQPDANPGNHPKSKFFFSYKIGDGSLDDETWVAVTALDFEGPITDAQGVLDGNNTANSTKKIFTITGLNIPNTATFWVRWEKDAAVDGVTNNDALAIDDFSIVAK